MKSLKGMMVVALLIILTVPISGAQGIPQATNPEEVGLSTERLNRISTWIKSDVDKGTVPGAVAIVLRKGKIAYYEAFGYQDREKKISMSRDSIFRISSLTKPFTSLAIMMLAEEGKIQTFNNVSYYLPEFKDLKVGVEKKDPVTGKTELVLETPSREMTVQDLLRHTSGLTWGFGKSIVKDRYREVRVQDMNQTNAEVVTKLSQIPLQYHPGTIWDYSISYDVLPRIAEVVSGVEFDTFVADRITKPLKLKDTAFWVEGLERQERIAEPQIDPVTGKRPAYNPDMTKKTKRASGNHGLVSTAYDYARFCQMFLNGGTLDGIRLVSRKTVEYMTSNSLPAGFKSSLSAQSQIMWPSPGVETGQGYGLGFGINCEPGLSPQPGSKGDYYWEGLHGPSFWVDPKEQLVAVVMLQSNAQLRRYQKSMRHYVYQAFGD